MKKVTSYYRCGPIFAHGPVGEILDPVVRISRVAALSDNFGPLLNLIAVLLVRDFNQSLTVECEPVIGIVVHGPYRTFKSVNLPMDVAIEKLGIPATPSWATVRPVRWTRP
jgi:hypothetical protein